MIHLSMSGLTFGDMNVDLMYFLQILRIREYTRNGHHGRTKELTKNSTKNGKKETYLVMELRLWLVKCGIGLN
jgi:hypothetical protein